MATTGTTEIAGGEKFSRSFYDILRSTPGNLFYSPISIEMALAMVHAGAGGNTAIQIQKATNIQPSKEATGRQYSTLIESLHSLDKDLTLKIANGLFAQEGFSIKPEFTNHLAKDFNASLGQVDFNSDAATDTINGWVSERTNGKIPQLFAPKSLDTATRLVLLNAIYFKGIWASPFDEANTVRDMFHVSEKEKIEVDFMSAKKSLRYASRDDLHAHIVELPYKGDGVSMLLVVPKVQGGLPQVEKLIRDVEVKDLQKDARKRDIVLKMPKFKLEQTHDLNDILQKLGITDIFSDTAADLSGISDQPLFLSKAIQKAYIEVNEQGSEAAAATGLMMAAMSLPPPPIALTLDQPFSFYIYHKSSETTLFVGRISIPSKA